MSDALALAPTPVPTASAPDPLAEIAAAALKLMVPVEAPACGVPVTGKYCGVIHAKLCQMRFVGLSDAEAARAVGISAETLRRWKARYPKLARAKAAHSLAPAEDR